MDPDALLDGKYIWQLNVMVQEANKAQRENMKEALMVAKCADPNELMALLSEPAYSDPRDAWADLAGAISGPEAKAKVERDKLVQILLKRSKQSGGRQHS